MSTAEVTAAVYLIWNLVNFSLMGIDKFKAKHDLWRIPESTLLGGCASLMGAVGSIIGSRFFHHKTQKKKFQYRSSGGASFQYSRSCSRKMFFPFGTYCINTE